MSPNRLGNDLEGRFALGLQALPDGTVCPHQLHENSQDSVTQLLILDKLKTISFVSLLVFLGVHLVNTV